MSAKGGSHRGGRPGIRWPAATALTAAVLVGLSACGPAPVAESPPETAAAETPPAILRAEPTVESFEILLPGQPRSGLLPPGSAHHHSLDLEAGDAALVEADQSQVDVEVTVLDPSGRQLLLFDSYGGQQAPERVCFVAAESGQHTVSLEAYSATGGRYTLRLLRQRRASSADHSCAEATRVFLDAEARRRAEPISEALAADYERSYDLWLDAGESLNAALSMREAGILSMSLGRGSRAAERYRRARAAAQAASAGFLEISLENLLGLALLDQGDLATARGVLNRALAQARQVNDREGEASAIHNLALVDQAAGETHRAIERYRQALPMWSEVGDAVGRGQTLINLAGAWALLDYHREALGLLADAQAIFRRLGLEDRLASALVATGWTHYLAGRGERSIAPLEEALAIYRELGSDDGEAIVLDRLGTALGATGDFGAALDVYRRSLAISEATGNAKDAAHTVSNIGCLHQELGKGAEARNLLDDARRRFEVLDDPKGASHVEYCRARVERDEGDIAAALERIAESLALVDELRAVAYQRGARYRPIWLWQDYSELQVELLIARYRQTDDENFAARAFEASDLARARNLFELVLESRADVRAAAGGELLAREHEVQERLNAAHIERQRLEAAAAADSRSDAELADLERRLGELSLELEETRAAIRAADPRFAELAAPRPVRLAEVQALLDAGTVLLSYALGAEHSYLFVVGRETFEPWPLAGRRRLEAQVQALYEGLRRSHFDPYQHLLTALGLRDLLLPEGAVPAGTRRLLVTPDGMLHYVPMGALPSRGRDGQAPRRLLADDFEISTLPSAAVLAALVRRDAERAPAPEPAIVFADAIFGDSDPRLQGSGASGIGAATERLPQGPLPRLPHTRFEANRILELTSPQGVGILGFNATKERVLAGDLERYRILHFATHALIDERFPELSGLVLSRRDREGRPIDGDLHLHEIYGLRLAADLVVLSGCQTALGQRVRGDGLVSLTRGFLYAGSSRLLVSLWSVDDEATAVLMGELYRGMMGRGESPAAALRSAQQWMRRQERWREPYYWAGFVLQGAGS